MSVMLCTDQLEELVDRITSRQKDTSHHKDPHFVGELRGRLENILPDYDFIVDRWPDFKAVVGVVNKSRTRCPRYICPQVPVYAEDCTALVTLLLQPGLLDWSSKLEFIIVSAAEKEAIEARIPFHHNVRFGADPFLVMRVHSQTLQQSSVPETFRVTTIPLALASLVRSIVQFSDADDTHIYIEDMLRKLPSCCMYDGEGNVVGFALQYHYGFIGMLHVFEEYRGRGYSKVIMSHLANICLDKDKEVYVYVSVKNKVSIKLHTSIGFKRLTHLIYILHCYPNQKKQSNILDQM